MLAPFDLQSFVKDKKELQKIERMNKIVYSGLFIIFFSTVFFLFISLVYTLLFTS